MTQEAVNNAKVLYRLGATRQEADELRELYELTPELLKVLTSPVISIHKKDAVIEKIYQDTTNKVSSHRSHFPLSELKELIPEELRAQVFCMHFGCDFSAEIEQLGFNNAEKYLAQQR